MFPLVPQDSDFFLWAILIAIVAFGFWAERQTRWGQKMTGILVTLLVAMLFSNLKIIPTSAPVYSIMLESLLPIAIPLLLFRADLRQAAKEAGPTLLAFAIGAIGILIGVMIAVQVVPLGDLEAPMAGMFAATYIGGVANFAAVSQAIEFNQAGAYIAALGADNIATYLVTLFLIALPGLTFLSKFFKNKHATISATEKRTQTSKLNTNLYKVKKLDLVGLAVALAAAFFLAELGGWTAELLGVPTFGILFITTYALIVANFAPKFVNFLSGDFEAGIFLIFLFLAAMAASADVWVLLDIGPLLFVFAAVLLGVHLFIVLLIGRLANLDISEIIIGSTACVGGITSATAIASAKGWPNLVTPGIIVGTIGNSIGTFIGVWVWSFLA